MEFLLEPQRSRYEACLATDASVFNITGFLEFLPPLPPLLLGCWRWRNRAGMLGGKAGSLGDVGVEGVS